MFIYEPLLVFDLRFWLPVIASGDGASVNVLFVGNVAPDFVGKTADVLPAGNYYFHAN